MDKLALLEDLRRQLKEAREKYSREEGLRIEKIAEENGIDETFIYMEDHVFNILKNKSNFKNFIEEKE